MPKETEAQRRAHLKYRKEKTHSLVMNFPKQDFEIIEKYCALIQFPVATWVRSLIWKEIEANATFEYSRKKKWSRNGGDQNRP